MEFEIGDIVQLKSGGPAMTVEDVGKQSYSDKPGIWCVWFERVGNKQETKRDCFHPATLEKSEGGGDGGFFIGSVGRG